MRVPSKRDPSHPTCVPLRRPLARLAVFVSLVAIAAGLACSDSSGPVGPVVATIDVAGLPDSIGIGDTLRLSGEPRAADGASVTGVTVRWRSLSPDIATIDS